MSEDPQAAAPKSLADRIRESADSFEDAVELIFNEAIAVVRDRSSAHISFASLGTRLEKLRDSVTGRNQEAPAAETVVVGQPDTGSTEAASSPAAEETPVPSAEPPASTPPSSEGKAPVASDEK